MCCNLVYSFVLQLLTTLASNRCSYLLINFLMQMLAYEFVSNGTLRDHLSGNFFVATFLALLLNFCLLWYGIARRN